ncbi:hypothetical protein EDWATA_00755 [Edwardsiella tarda ATCC 23685]|uniref:Uncharacterized protein n=1 Tax=Edwardsiella tarda ATCC 23685 TaxID=500638 RepID=D4F211_EDWTA|nr:hypothetical protein EDWATA_00755 [Edwardsiella tarda ATCC 23685]
MAIYDNAITLREKLSKMPPYPLKVICSQFFPALRRHNFLGISRSDSQL